MSFMEMLLALFAIVFFTTVSLVYNQSMWSQAESLDKATKVIQATQLAHSRLDEIDAKLFSKQIAFAKRSYEHHHHHNHTETDYDVGPIGPFPVKDTFTATLASPEVVNMGYTGDKFKLSYDFQYCDSLGNALTNQSYNENALFFKMTVVIDSTPGMKYPVKLSRIYTKTNLNI
jgi:hypothetical protein